MFEFDKNLKLIFLKYVLEIECVIRSKISEIISQKYGIKNYLIEENFDNNLSVNDIIGKINDTISKQRDKHPAVKHYLSVYNYIPPYVLVKILTFGEISRLFGILKQSDRQMISKTFKIPDNVLKQILINTSMARNVCAHNDRLYNFRSKFLISFKNIDSNYINNDNLTNIYMIMKSMQLLLDDSSKIEFEKSMNKEIKKLKIKIESLDFNLILKKMGLLV